MGYVYLLSTVTPDGLTERFKIGITRRSIDKRMRELQTGNSDKITLINSYESENYIKVENWLHRKHYCTQAEAKNEWFELAPEKVLSFIEDCKKIDKTVTFLKENNEFYD